MKRLIILLIFFVLIPSQANARFQLPDPANLTVVVNTNGTDNTFDFNISDQSGSVPLLYNQFELPTTNGTARHTISLSTFGSNDYFINQALPTGWTTKSISCVTDNPGNGINIFTNFAQITNPVPDSNITCIFTNSKVNLKIPVLIVPGLLGTEISKGSTLLWADIQRMINPLNTDSFMDPLTFQSNLNPLDTSLELGGVITKKFKTIGQQQITLYDYSDALINLFTSPSIGYTEGKDLFTFPYDWRFGVSEDVVAQLKQKIQDIIAQTGSQKVDVVAHSTGGLIVKKYVMENPDNNNINKAVFVGVPNLGAPKAFKVLINGDNFDIPGLDGQEMKKISQNLPIAYDLAPSAQYDSAIGSFFHVHNPLASVNQVDQDLSYSATITNLENQNLLNNQGVTNGQNLHTPTFDNYDIRNNGVDVYNIIGCKTGTFGNFTEVIQKTAAPMYDFPKDTTGDGTVPLLSAQTIPSDPSHVFFAPKADHGKMPSQDGIRQEIVSLISGVQVDTNGKILTHDAVQNNPALCQIKGESIQIKSPVAIGVTDQNGNFSGLASDGSVQNDIPGADYEIWGEHKYVFLPTDDNQNYNIQLAGTGTGTFTLDDQKIDGNTITQTQVFSNLPVTPALTGQVNLETSDKNTILSLQMTPDSTPIIITPSSTINADQSEDITPPVSAATIIGTLGQPGFYRSNVTLALAAIDVINNTEPLQTSGVMKTNYNLDNQGYVAYGTSTNLTISTEGLHTLSFFSTDNAGNNEDPQTVSFTIDKTAPESSIQFNPGLKDVQFSGSDNLSASSAITVLDQDDIITLADQAGNTTQIKLAAKNRRVTMAASLKSLSYNGQAQDISKNIFAFLWKFDNKNNLTFLSQNVAAKKTYNILALYDGKKTSLIGIDKTGIIAKSLPGLDLLKVTTNKGDFAWGY